jgi:hypothetical protein
VVDGIGDVTTGEYSPITTAAPIAAVRASSAVAASVIVSAGVVAKPMSRALADVLG